MATSVYTFLVTYEGLEEKIWRKVQVSSNYRLDRLGYLVLGTFEALANYFFAFEYKEFQFELPDEEGELEALNMVHFRLGQLKLAIGDELKMVYDFGIDQVFRLKLLSVGPMPQGQGKRYPQIIDGAGRGILDDVPADETRLLIQQIDQNGHTDEPIYYDESKEPWDYRKFDASIANMLIKQEIAWI